MDESSFKWFTYVHTFLWVKPCATALSSKRTIDAEVLIALTLLREIFEYRWIFTVRRDRRAYSHISISGLSPQSFLEVFWHYEKFFLILLLSKYSCQLSFDGCQNFTLLDEWKRTFYVKNEIIRRGVHRQAIL